VAISKGEPNVGHENLLGEKGKIKDLNTQVGLEGEETKFCGGS